MCRSRTDGHSRRCRHDNPLLRARERTGNRMGYNRRQMIAAVSSGDDVAAKRYAVRLASDSVSLQLVDPQQPGLLSGVNLTRLSEAELVTLAGRPDIQGDARSLDAVYGEIDRRDTNYDPGGRERSVLAAARAFHNTAGDTMKVGAAIRATRWSEAAAAMDRVLLGPDHGRARSRLRRQVYHLYGIRDPQQDREASAKADWRALIASRRLDAEGVCRGRMLRRKSEDRGIDPAKLFTASAQWIRAHASREFLDWLSDNPRITQAQYLAQVLPDSARWQRQAATASQSSSDLARY